MIPALPAALLPFAEPRSCRCSARVSFETGRFPLCPPLCCRLPSLADSGCSARVSFETGRFSLCPPLCCRLPSLEVIAVLPGFPLERDNSRFARRSVAACRASKLPLFCPGFLWNGTAALASIPYYYNIAKFLYGKESLQKNSIAIFLPCNAEVSLFLLFSAPHFKSVTPDSSEIAAVEKHLARSGLVRFRPADPPQMQSAQRHFVGVRSAP